MSTGQFSLIGVLKKSGTQKQKYDPLFPGSFTTSYQQQIGKKITSRPKQRIGYVLLRVKQFVVGCFVKQSNVTIYSSPGTKFSPLCYTSIQMRKQETQK